MLAIFSTSKVSALVHLLRKTHYMKDFYKFTILD